MMQHQKGCYVIIVNDNHVRVTNTTMHIAWKCLNMFQTSRFIHISTRYRHGWLVLFGLPDKLFLKVWIKASTMLYCENLAPCISPPIPKGHCQHDQTLPDNSWVQIHQFNVDPHLQPPCAEQPDCQGHALNQQPPWTSEKHGCLLGWLGQFVSIETHKQFALHHLLMLHWCCYVALDQCMNLLRLIHRQLAAVLLSCSHHCKLVWYLYDTQFIFEVLKVCWWHHPSASWHQYPQHWCIWWRSCPHACTQSTIWGRCRIKVPKLSDVLISGIIKEHQAESSKTPKDPHGTNLEPIKCPNFVETS